VREATSDEVKELRAENRELKEVVAELLDAELEGKVECGDGVAWWMSMWRGVGLGAWRRGVSSGSAVSWIAGERG
jgi:hypothetical protein